MSEIEIKPGAILAQRFAIKLLRKGTKGKDFKRITKKNEFITPMDYSGPCASDGILRR